MAKAMRKVRTGTVVRAKTEKTAVVETIWKQRHRLYRKQQRRVARFQVHDPLSQCQLGDVVRIEEVRPISKTKRWRLLEILERRQVAEVRPIDLESDAELTVIDDPVAQDDALVTAELDADEPETDAAEDTEPEDTEPEDIQADDTVAEDPDSAEPEADELELEAEELSANDETEDLAAEDQDEVLKPESEDEEK